MTDALVIEGREIITLSTNGIIENGKILIDNGKIVSIGKDIKLPEKFEQITGEIVVPGLIDAHTHLGISPIESTDLQPTGTDSSDPVTPHLRVVDGLNPLDKGFENAVQGGITSTVVSAGSPMAWARPVEAITIMPGQNAVMKTNGRILNDHAGLKMGFGDHPKRYMKLLKMPPNTSMGIIAIMRSYFEKAKLYTGDIEIPFTEKNREKLEALVPLLRGEYPAHIHVHKANDILKMIRFAGEYKFNAVLIHATESHLVADEITSTGTSVVFGPMIFPRRGGELANLTNETPAMLEEKGILFAISTDHPCTPIEYLSINAGLAMVEGLRDGLRPITSNAAKIAGIWDRVGSIEEGKDADIAIFDGDPTEADSNVLYTIIDGKVEYGGE
jgi:imidazolonepropionase-like amidohydrolase